ncbi:MAG: peptidase T [Bacillota bacterium]|nr:peptidase T [Bacillota bacterium]
MYENFDFKKIFEEKFLRYLAIESQSNKDNPQVPSSQGQWTLARLLAEELKDLGLEDVKINDYAVVQGVLKKRLKTDREVPTIGWVCHLDTVDVALSPEIKPVIIRNYQGGDIVQNQEKNLVLKVSEFPELESYKGQDLIMSDGTSVLGADNKAAIANIMTVLEYLKANPHVDHGQINIAFVPDEEIGLRGARKIDFDSFKVDYAYTIDSCQIGEVVYETFNAGSGKVKIKGVSAHPMSAKGKLVNPLMVAVDFINLLDRSQSPENTEGREGYIWVNGLSSDVINAEIDLNIRDHSKAGYENKKAYLRQAVDLIKAKYPKAEISIDLQDVYANIHDAVRDDNRACIDNIYKVFEDLDIEPITLAMRGGTDGSYLSSQGILTPNYFTGAHNFHSRGEFLPMDSAEKSCLVTLKLIEEAAKDQ